MDNIQKYFDNIQQYLKSNVMTDEVKQILFLVIGFILAFMFVAFMFEVKKAEAELVYGVETDKKYKK